MQYGSLAEPFWWYTHTEHTPAGVFLHKMRVSLTCKETWKLTKDSSTKAVKTKMFKMWMLARFTIHHYAAWNQTISFNGSWWVH